MAEPDLSEAPMEGAAAEDERGLMLILPDAIVVHLEKTEPELANFVLETLTRRAFRQVQTLLEVHSWRLRVGSCATSQGNR